MSGRSSLPGRIAALGLLAGLFASGCSSTPLPPLLQQAEQLERDRRTDEALAVYARAERECGSLVRNCIRAALGRARLFESARRYPEALAAFRALADNSRADPSVRARALSSVGELLGDHLSDEPAGERALWDTVSRYPDEVGADRALASLVRRYKRRSAERELVRRLDALYSQVAAKQIGEHLAYAAAELVAGWGEPEALERYRALAKRHPKGQRVDDALWRAGELLRRRGDVDGALATYAQLVGRYESSYFTGTYNSVWMDDAQLAIARLYLDKKGDPVRAIAAARKLFKLFPDSMLRAQASWLIAEAHLKAGERAAACAELGALIRKFPDSRLRRQAATRQRELGCGG